MKLWSLVARRRFELLSWGPRPHMLSRENALAATPPGYRKNSYHNCSLSLSQVSLIEWFSLFKHLFWEPFIPLLHERNVVLSIAELVRQHMGYFVNDWVPSLTVRACHYPLYYLICLLKNVEFQGVVFANWTCEDVEELEFH